MVIIILVSLFSILFGHCSSPLSGVVSSWIPVGSLLFAHPVDVLVFGAINQCAPWDSLFSSSVFGFGIILGRYVLDILLVFASPSFVEFTFGMVKLASCLDAWFICATVSER